MTGREHHRNASLLVAGAGLTGAAVAWLAARAGIATLVVSDERPATQGSALFPGVVRGLGPPEDFDRWARASAAERKAVQRREELGMDLLRELLLRAKRDVGFRRIAHLAESAPGMPPERVEEAGAALSDAGFGVRVEGRNGTGILVRERDAMLDRRRLTFELLRAARGLGAELSIPQTLRDLGRVTPEGRHFELARGSRVFDAVVWAGDDPYPGESGAGSYLRRSVLVQVMDAGEEQLDLVLQTAGGAVCLAPLPGGESPRTLLVRTASEAGGRGTFWPEVPRAWDAYRGRARRQRLVEAVIGPAFRRFVARDGVISLTGLSAWPVASLIGACSEALNAVTGN